MKTTSQKLPKRILTIAGSESGGTAGIQADFKTFQEIGVYGMSVITAMVGQHPKTKRNVHTISIENIEAQFAGAYKRTGVDAVKTAMLFSEDVILKVSELLSDKNPKHLIVDPVMVGKLGKMDSKLLKDEAIEALKKNLLPMAELIMPNMLEAMFLIDGKPIETQEDIKKAAVKLHALGPKNVFIKGGQLKGDTATDILFDGKDFYNFETPRIDTKNTSGAGDTISAAIAAYLAQGYSMVESIEKGKRFVTIAIAGGFSFGQIPVGAVNPYANRLSSEIEINVTQKTA